MELRLDFSGKKDYPPTQFSDLTRKVHLMFRISKDILAYYFTLLARIDYLFRSVKRQIVRPCMKRIGRRLPAACVCAGRQVTLGTQHSHSTPNTQDQYWVLGTIIQHDSNLRRTSQ
ncbi:hypothetical protein BH20ACI3_BH20ACI3_34720 [soil metagenome]